MKKLSTLHLLIVTTLLLASLPACTPVRMTDEGSMPMTEENDRRSAGTVVDDQGVEMMLTKKIRSHPDLSKKVHVNVTSYNLQVLLTGEAPSAELRDQVLKMASNANNVRNVYNAISIAEPTPFSSRNNDTWITSKVKTRMLGKAEIDATRIKVLTENSWVYLMGLVTPEEADHAAKLASEVEGVRRVVKVFEYIE